MYCLGTQNLRSSISLAVVITPLYFRHLCLTLNCLKMKWEGGRDGVESGWSLDGTWMELNALHISWNDEDSTNRMSSVSEEVRRRDVKVNDVKRSNSVPSRVLHSVSIFNIYLKRQLTQWYDSVYESQPWFLAQIRDDIAWGRISSFPTIDFLSH